MGGLSSSLMADSGGDGVEGRGGGVVCGFGAGFLG